MKIVTSIKRSALRRGLCTFFVGASALWASAGNIQAGNVVWETQPAINGRLSTYGVGKYKATGGTINAHFIPEEPWIGGILAAGDILYVATELVPEGQSGQFVIATYNPKKGAVINFDFFAYKQGVQYNPAGMALSGTNLYVANYEEDSIAKIDTTTGGGNADFIKVGDVNGIAYPYALAIKGNILYVTNNYGDSNGKVYISEYDATSGAQINPLFIELPLTGLYGLAVKGDILYVSVFGGNSGIPTGVYTYNATTGALIKGPFVSVDEPWGITIVDDTLYVASYHDFVIYEFNATTGKKLSDSITLNYEPINITAEPAIKQ
ncbi:MAG: hypothetical protein JO170_22240 [Verrucomicrobia bacterium]|nr:hypothetical protein [Verrucomicrobiota bacterium]